MAKFTPQTVDSGHYTNVLLNENFTELATLCDTFVSRDGTSPNTMTAPLDMNAQRIINNPSGVASNDFATIAQLRATTHADPFTGTVVEKRVATAGQTVFDLSLDYVPGSDNLTVYRNGLYIDPSYYSETDSDTVIFSFPANPGDQYVFVANIRGVDATVYQAEHITYLPRFGNSTNVDAFLDRRIPVFQDFGTIGVGNDLAVMQAAVNACPHVMGVPGTVYNLTNSLVIPNNVIVDFAGCEVRRQTNSGAYDMIINANGVAGVTGVTIKNLYINGNKDANALVRTNPAHRFCGIKFTGSNNITLENIKVTATVNDGRQVAGNRCAIILELSNRCTVRNITSTGNDGNGFGFHETTESSLSTFNSTSDTLSGLYSYKANDCRYSNLDVESSGTTGINISGVRSNVNGVSVRDCGSTGFAIAGSGGTDNSYYSVINNVNAYNCQGRGIFVSNSRDTSLSNIYADTCCKSATNFLAQVYCSSSPRLKLNNVTASGFVGVNTTAYGIRMIECEGSQLDNITAYINPSHGIYISDLGSGIPEPTTIGTNILCTGNGVTNSAGSAGLYLNNCNVIIHGGQYGTSSAQEAEQEAGISVNNSTVCLKNAFIPLNRLYTIASSGTNTYSDLRYRISETAPVYGSFTAANGVVNTTVANTNVKSSTLGIRVWPLNTAAVLKGVGGCTSVVAGTSFTISFPTSTTGTEIYGFEIL